jgi:DNA polymerase-3 subunit alpha
VLLLPPCVNRSSDRYEVETDAPEVAGVEQQRREVVGAIRVPLSAIRGLSTEAVRHILATRKTFGPFTSLLDFCRRIERSVVDRRRLLVLIKLGAFGFTGVPRAQLALAEQVYAAAADLLRAADRSPTALGPLEEELAQLVSRYLDVVEWPPEVLAADELAHLGFYLAGSDAHHRALRIAEEFSTLEIAALADHPHHAPVTIAGIITTLRIRQTRKGEEMAWLSITDPSGSVECGIFPSAYQRLGQPSLLREGAFLVARGRVAHEEATGTKVWLDQIVPVSSAGAHLRALATAVEQQRAGLPVD